MQHKCSFKFWTLVKAQTERPSGTPPPPPTRSDTKATTEPRPEKKAPPPPPPKRDLGSTPKVDKNSGSTGLSPQKPKGSSEEKNDWPSPPRMDSKPKEPAPATTPKEKKVELESKQREPASTPKDNVETGSKQVEPLKEKTYESKTTKDDKQKSKDSKEMNEKQAPKPRSAPQNLDRKSEEESSQEDTYYDGSDYYYYFSD